jgi:hypothetical protein
LTDVCKQKAGESERKPRELDGTLAEGTQVCKEGFDSGESQEQAAETFPAFFSIPH